MSIKCQETTNIEIINAEVTKTTQLWQNMINYIKQYNDITKEQPQMKPPFYIN